MGEGEGTAPRAGRWPTITIAWLALSALTQLPYLNATLRPPEGRAFTGFFYYVDDQYNYFSYVTQAERGRFLFDNALVLKPHPRSFINLEWWGTGMLSRLLGGRPFLAWRIVGALACLALVAAADRWLAYGGLPSSHRLPALLLVGLGGGAGAAGWRLGLVAETDALDKWAGVYPAVEMLANPHFVSGTALLAWSLYAFQRARTWRQHLVAIAAGTALALIRPYDFVILGAAHLLAVLLVEPPRQWLARLWSLAGLLPAVGYLAWIFYAVPWFGSFSRSMGPPRPPAVAFMLAFSPALILLAATWRSGAVAPREARIAMATWIGIVSAVLVLWPVSFALQFAVGLGMPLLVLLALGLGRLSPVVTAIAAAGFATTAACVLELMLRGTPPSHDRPEYVQAAAVLRERCRWGEVAFVPEEMGRYVLGLTTCRAYVSHPVAPAHTQRKARLQGFYASADPSERAALLDAVSAVYLILPAAVDGRPLEPPNRFHPIGVVGEAGRALRLYARTR